MEMMSYCGSESRKFYTKRTKELFFVFCFFVKNGKEFPLNNLLVICFNAT